MHMTRAIQQKYNAILSNEEIKDDGNSEVIFTYDIH